MGDTKLPRRKLLGRISFHQSIKDLQYTVISHMSLFSYYSTYVIKLKVSAVTGNNTSRMIIHYLYLKFIGLTKLDILIQCRTVLSSVRFSFNYRTMVNEMISIIIMIFYLMKQSPLIVGRLDQCPN